MRRFMLAAVPVIAVLAGCSYIANDTFQMVQVLTPGVIGAECTLATHDGIVRVISPATVQVSRSPLDLKVECHKASYYTALLTIKASYGGIAKSAFLNLPNGVVPGTAFDVASKAVYNYPDVITVRMEQDPDAVAATALVAEPPSETLVKKKSEDAIPPPAVPQNAPAEKTMSKALRK